MEEMRLDMKGMEIQDDKVLEWVEDQELDPGNSVPDNKGMKSRF